MPFPGVLSPGTDEGRRTFQEEAQELANHYLVALESCSKSFSVKRRRWGCLVANMGFVRRSSGMAEAKEHERNRKRRRESRYLRAARIAYAIAQEALPHYSHPKSPHIYTLPQLAACVLPGFTTLYRAYRLGKDEAGPVGEAGGRGRRRGLRSILPGFASPRRAPATGAGPDSPIGSSKGSTRWGPKPS